MVLGEPASPRCCRGTKRWLASYPLVVLSQSTADFLKAVPQITLTFDLKKTTYSNPILDSFLSALNLLFWTAVLWYNAIVFNELLFPAVTLIIPKIQGDLFNL